MTSFKKYLFLSLFVALLSLTAVLCFFSPRVKPTVDSEQYSSTILYIAGDQSAVLYPFRLVKPMPLLIGAALLPLMTAKEALILQSIFFYFASVLLIFLLVNLVYKNERQAFYGAVLFSTAYPVLAYGFSPLTDFGGWFFYILCVYLTIKFFGSMGLKESFLIGFLGGVGMLFKENLGALLLFFPSFIFVCTSFPLKKKIKHIATFLFAFFLPVVVVEAIIYYFFSYSLVQWYINFSLHQGKSFFYVYSGLRTIIEIARVFFIGWIFFLVGVVSEIKIKDKNRTKILISLVPASLSFLLWAFIHNRIVFISAPLIVLLGSFGLIEAYKNVKFGRHIQLAALFLFVLVNYFLVEFFLRYGDILRPMF